MQPDGEPIIENPSRPMMGAAKVARSDKKSRGENPDKPAPDEGGAGRMPKAAKSPRAKKGVSPAGPMIAKNKGSRAARPSAQPGPGYLRMLVEVKNGAMRVLSTHEVPGPLVRPSTLGSGFAYEVRQDGQPLHVENVPDLGVSRSFPSPNPKTEAMAGHNISQTDEASFNVRMPQPDSAARARTRPVEIILYRVKETPSNTQSRAIGDNNPLESQFGRQLREVARLENVMPDKFKK